MSAFLVTGAAGFIGSAIVRGLLCHVDTVRALDNFSSGRWENIADVAAQLDLREADLADRNALRAACEGIDCILHQAALNAVPRSIDDPVSTHAANATGTLNLLMAAQEAGVRRFLYAGSSCVYGETDSPSQHELLPANPVSPYAVSKLAGEHYVRVFHRIFGLETICLRYFNVFGPRQNLHSRYAAAIPRFVSQMLIGEPPTIFGDGLQSRDFTYVENVVDANLLAASAPAAEVAGRTFNVGCGHSVTLNQIVDLLRELTGYEGAVLYALRRPGDLRHTLADISLARKHLGYEPRVDLAEGLNRTVAWYRSHMTALSEPSAWRATNSRM